MAIDVRGKAKMLGDSVLELQPYKVKLTDISEDGLRIPLIFKRDENPVGRFVANLKLIGNDILPQQYFINGAEDGKEHPDRIKLNRLPLNHIEKDFRYRVRVNVYSGFSLKKENELPAYVVESCLTDKETEHAEHEVQISGTTPDTVNPIFNHQFLLDVKDNDYKTKHLYLGFVDEKTKQYADQVYLSLSPFQIFVPICLEVVGSESSIKRRQSYFISVVVEDTQEDIIDLVVKDLEVDPEIENSEIDCFSLAMTLDNKSIEAAQFKRVEVLQLEPKKIPQPPIVDLCLKASESPIFISTINTIPVLDVESHYRSLYVFVVPRSYLKRSLKFSMLVINTKYNIEEVRFPNYVSGETLALNPETRVHSQVDELGYDYYIINHKVEDEPKFDYVLYKMIEERQFKLKIIAFTPYQDILKVIDLEEEKQKAEIQKHLETEALTAIQMQLVSDNLATALVVQDDDTKWQLMTNEINQKQQLINRFMLEYEDKLKIFKSTSNQINELRKQIQLFEAEEEKLRRRLTMEKRIETITPLRKELEDLSEQELRVKLIRVAQAYKEEREKNKEFEKAMQNAQMELVKVRKLQKEYDALSVEHLKKNKELSEMQDEIAKYQMYKETVAKQEKVIAKLETNLEKCVDYGEKYNRLIENIGAIERENVELQKEIENQMRNFEESNGDGKLAEEVDRLEKIRNQLKQELANKRPISRQRAEISDKKMELEVTLQNLKERARALENELHKNNKKYADEIVNLRQDLRYEDTDQSN